MKEIQVIKGIAEFLLAQQVGFNVLAADATVRLEQAWRAIYEIAFREQSRMKQGRKADFAFQQLECAHYWVIPFSSKVVGTEVAAGGLRFAGLECRGPLVGLGRFHCAEFFISPIDFDWTMVHTHEDHAFGGPYFLYRDWVPSPG